MSIVAVSLPDHQVEQIRTLKERIKSHSVVIVDVRFPEEIEENGKIDCDRWINMPDYLGVGKEFLLTDEEFKVKYGIEKPVKPGTELVFHCLGGKKGSNAVAAMSIVGYDRCKNLEGGFMRWAAKQGTSDC